MQIELWISWKSADLMLRSKNWKKEILVNKLKQQSGYVKYHANRIRNSLGVVSRMFCFCCFVICIVETEKEIWLVQTNRIGNSLEERKKKLSTKLMGVCSGKVFTAPVCWGGIVDIK